MRLSAAKPISYFKAHAAEILAELEASREPVAITQNGEVKAVVQDVASFGRVQETLPLLKLLAVGMADNKAGRTVHAGAAVAKPRRAAAG